MTTSRAQIFSLYARREAARGAVLGRALATARAQEAEALRMADRLKRLLGDMAAPRGQIAAAGLRDAALLAATLAAEAARHEARAGAEAPEIARLRALVGQHEQRRSFGERAAAAASADAAAASEAREDAARAPYRRGR